MALSTSIRSVKINDNVINVGRGSNTGSITNYAYDGCMQLAADAIVSRNTIAGCVGGGNSSVNLLTISNSSCTVRDNIFIRGAGSTVNSYISVSGSNDQTITGNVFDQPTVNGSSTVLVSGLSAGSHCNGNVNQTATVEATLSDRTLFYNNSSLTQATFNGTYGSTVDLFLTDAPAVSSTNSPFSDMFSIEDTAAGTNRVYLKRINLSSLVPRGAKIVGVQGGIVFNSAVSLSSGYWGLRLISYKKIANQSTSGSVLDASDFLFNTATHIQYDGYTNKDLLTVTPSVSTYLSLDLTNYLSSDVSENYRIGGEYNTILEWKVAYGKSGTTAMSFSPMVVSFRW